MMTLVWDPFIRLFHWALALAFCTAYMTGDGYYELHLWLGYTVLALVLMRLPWGLLGPRHARFQDFVAGPRRTLAYAAAFLRGRAARHLGHNPLAGWMIVLLLLVLTITALSGITLDAAENRSGPLGSTRLFIYGDIIEAAHLLSTNLALALIGLHLAGVAATSWMYRENLPAAMITGYKRPHTD
ncbi:cytochrome b/b6 domain-containing protein [Thiohalocapsa halophila]|nr:cytochrome b/b6 domain-containing protein [Thiohalocapsa halophila]